MWQNLVFGVTHIIFLKRAWEKLFLGSLNNQTGHPLIPCFLGEILGVKALLSRAHP
jgi:hypothetical protein